MAIIDKLQDILEIKNNIKNSLTNKGAILTNKDFVDYPVIIDNLQTSSIINEYDDFLNSIGVGFYSNNDTELMRITKDIWTKYNITANTPSYTYEGIKDIVYFLPKLNKISNFRDYTYQATLLKTIPLVDVSDITTLNTAFYDCASIEYIPALVFNNISSLASCFIGCYNLRNIDILEFRGFTTAASAFRDCKSLIKVPKLYCDSCTNIDNVFRNCKSLKEIYIINTNLITNFGYAFFGCVTLETINGELDFSSNKSDITNTFASCSKLKNIIIKPNSISVNISLNDCLDLTAESITQFVNGCSDVSTTKKITFNPYIQTYKRITDEQIATLQTKGWTVEFSW